MASEAPKPACVLCGESRRRTLLVKDGYPIARCARCGLVYVDADLGMAELIAHYGPDYYDGGVFANYLGERAERLASARRYCDILAALQPTGRLLDVGCAMGLFLEAAAARWQVSGVELSSAAAAYARREFGHEVFTGDVAEVDLPESSFDIVTLWNTVEHMADPMSAMCHVARALVPGGVVALTTGDVSGPLARRDLANWNLMSPPEHLYFFSPRTITQLLAQAGLTVRRIVHDGIIGAGGIWTKPSVRRAASAVGLGNVMTVYARRTGEASPARRLASRLRPVARV